MVINFFFKLNKDPERLRSSSPCLAHNFDCATNTDGVYTCVCRLIVGIHRNRTTQLKINMYFTFIVLILDCFDV